MPIEKEATFSYALVKQLRLFYYHCDTAIPYSGALIFHTTL